MSKLSDFLSRNKYPITGLLLLAGFTLHFIIPRAITEVKPLKNISARLGLTSKCIVGIDSLTQSGHFSVPSDDQIIEFNYLQAETDHVSSTIILVHGIKSSKEQWLPIQRKLSKHGHNSLALDLRAHGESTGYHCTFGSKEKNDISAIIDLLMHDSLPVIIWGQSLGGAVAVETMAYDKRIDVGIIESTFTDLRTIVHDYSEYHLGFDIAPFTDYLLNRAGRIADFDPDQVSPSDAVMKIPKPILFVHGEKDKRISQEYSKELYQNSRNTESKLLIIEDANHLNVWSTGGELYFNEVLNYITNQLQE